MNAERQTPNAERLRGRPLSEFVITIRRDQLFKLFHNGSEPPPALTVRNGLRPIPFAYHRDAWDNICTAQNGRFDRFKMIVQG